MRYFVASKSHLLDYETFKFVKAAGVGVVDHFYPFYSDSKQLNRFGVVNLNGFKVEFDENSWYAGDFRAEVCVEGLPKIDISVSPSNMIIGRAGVSHEGYYYRVITDGRDIDDLVDLPEEKSIGFFNVSDLWKQPSDSGIELFYGLRHSPYTVIYKGKKLSGSCYALLCGACAIMLDDDLRYDSLALLNGANTVQLSVKRFCHTVNPYITKVMVMMK